MRTNSQVRVFAAFAMVAAVEALIWMTSGDVAAGRAFPVVVAIFFGILIALGLISGAVWFAERGGSGAYQISRKKEPVFYWMTMALYACACLAFVALYLR